MEIKYTYLIRPIDWNNLEDNQKYFMQKFRHIGKCDFEVIEKTEDKINTFYLGEFISQSAFLNLKQEESFKRIKKWLEENYPELMI
jgi:hypothetical protein